MARQNRWSVVLTVALGGCATEADLSGVPEAADQDEAALYGDAHFGSSCTPEERRFNERVLHFGRVAASSAAFGQCVDAAVRNGHAGIGPYRQCVGDPSLGDPVAQQITRVLAVARSANTVWMECTGSGALASTDLGTYAHDDDEQLWWGPWLRNAIRELDLPLQSTGATPGRWAPEPWPYDQAAEIIWHEVIHTHGYTHGANDQANALVNCGYANDPTWHFQVNTMPYIVGQCLGHVLSRSGTVCGDVEACPEGQLRIIDGLTSGTCACLDDPYAPEASTDAFSLHNREQPWFTAVLSQHGVQVVSGDFDGDGRADLAATGGPGWGSVPVAFGNGDGTFRETNAPIADFAGWARAPGARLLAADFDRDGRTDVALTGGHGWTTLPVAISRGDGSFIVRNYGLADFPGWATQANVQALAGDFNGDGRGDVALTGGPGWGSLPVALGNGNGSFQVANYGLADFPTWAQAAGVRAVAGDFDGDGRDDVALAGGPGWSTIPVAFATSGGRFRVTNHGVNHLPGLATTAGVRVRSGDFDGDGRDDVALLGGAGWDSVVVGRSQGDGRFELDSRAAGFVGSLVANDGAVVPFVADVDANGRADVVLARPGAPGWNTLPVARSLAPRSVAGEYDNHRDDAVPVTSNTDLRALSIGYFKDVDYFQFDLTQQRSVWMNIDLDHARGDLDMMLLDGNGTELARSASSGNFEGFLRTLPAGRYFLRVYGYAYGTGPYMLRVVW